MVAVGSQLTSLVLSVNPKPSKQLHQTRPHTSGKHCRLYKLLTWFYNVVYDELKNVKSSLGQIEIMISHMRKEKTQFEHKL